MPELPTVTVTVEQQTRILEAYKAVFGTTTNAETVAAFKKMIADMVKNEVVAYEKRKIQQSAASQVEAKVAEAEAALQGF